MRAIDRAQAIKDMTSSEWNRGKGGKLDKVRGQQKLVIDKEPEFIYNREGDIVGVDAWVRLFDGSGKEVKIDPHRRIVNPPTVPRSGITVTDTGKKDIRGLPIQKRELTANPSEAFYETVWDSVATTPNVKGWRTRGTVTTVYGDSGDGALQSEDGGEEGNSGNYSQARAGTGDTVSTAFNNRVGQLKNTAGVSTSTDQYICYEGFFSFDVSSISSDDIVSAMDFSLYITSKDSSTDFVAEAREKAWRPSLASSDWVAGASLGGLTLLATRDTASSFFSGAYQTFVAESALLNHSSIGTGTLELLVNSSRHRLGNNPSNISTNQREDFTFSTSAVSGTTQDPKLEITHESPFTPSSPIMMNRPMRVWRLY